MFGCVTGDDTDMRNVMLAWPQQSKVCHVFAKLAVVVLCLSGRASCKAECSAADCCSNPICCLSGSVGLACAGFSVMITVTKSRAGYMVQFPSCRRRRSLLQMLDNSLLTCAYQPLVCIIATTQQYSSLIPSAHSLMSRSENSSNAPCY